MEYRPGVNPESIFLKTWFHLTIALLLAAGIVGVMLYNVGGRVTTTPGTYIDRDHTRVRSEQDRFRNKTVTRRKVPQNKGGGGGGFGGGGTTGGGRSFSGGGRKLLRHSKEGMNEYGIFRQSIFRCSGMGRIPR